MGTVREYQRKNGSVSYHAEVRLRGQKKQRASFRTMTQAKQWIQATESAIRDGRFINVSEARRRTVGEMIDRFIEKWLPKFPNRLPKQKALLTWWKDKCGHLLLSELTPSVIAECRDELVSSNTIRGTIRNPATCNRYLSSLSKVLTVAVKEWSWLDDNPMRKIEKFKESTGRDRYLSQEERERLLAVCYESKSPFLYPLVALSLITGARYGELVGLRYGNVCYDSKTIVFRKTKNGDDRKIPLTQEAEEILRGISTDIRPQEDLIFESSKPSRKNKRVSVRRGFEIALEKAKIKDFRWHDLRHSCASFWAVQGFSQNELMELLGHKSASVSRRYTHFSQEHLAGLMAKASHKLLRAG